MSEREKRVSTVMLNDTTRAEHGSLPLSPTVGENNTRINTVIYFFMLNLDLRFDFHFDQLVVLKHV